MLQLVLKALAHAINGKKGDMHERHVERLVYKVQHSGCPTIRIAVLRSGTCSRRTRLPLGSTYSLIDAGKEVLADDDEARKPKPPRRGLLDKEPLQWLLDHWDVVLCLGEQLRVSKGKGGIYLAKNFRCGEWGAVVDWLKWPQMKMRVAHLLEFSTRITVEQRWSRGGNENRPFECSFKFVEMLLGW